MSGTLMFLAAGLTGAIAAPMSWQGQREASAGTERKPQKPKPKLRLVGGKDVPLDEPYDARMELARKPSLPAIASARHFATWLRKYHVGKHSDRVLMSLYDEFCTIESVEPTAENLMRSELREMRGIRRVVESTTKNGKRHRPVKWWIEGPRAEPAPNAKRRKAA